MKRIMLVFWPSFVVGGVAEVLFFTLVNPRELYVFGEPVHFSALATYSIGFFAFWALCAASSLLTCYLDRNADDVNRAGHNNHSSEPGKP